MIAAIARWPIAIVRRNAPMAALFSYVFLLMLVAYDLGPGPSMSPENMAAVPLPRVHQAGVRHASPQWNF